MNCDCGIELTVIEASLTGLCEDCEGADDFCSFCGTGLDNYIMYNNIRYCSDCYKEFNDLITDIEDEFNEAKFKFNLEKLRDYAKVR